MTDKKCEESLCDQLNVNGSICVGFGRHRCWDLQICRSSNVSGIPRQVVTVQTLSANTFFWFPNNPSIENTPAPPPLLLASRAGMELPHDIGFHTGIKKWTSCQGHPGSTHVPLPWLEEELNPEGQEKETGARSTHSSNCQYMTWVQASRFSLNDTSKAGSTQVHQCSEDLYD